MRGTPAVLLPAATCSSRKTRADFEYRCRRHPGRFCSSWATVCARELDRTGRQDMNKRALISGITGQDGAYLAELLLKKGYEVHGIKRPASSFNTERIDHLYEDPHARDVHLRLHYGDLTDATNMLRIIQQVQP